jgi:hypothetical protein
MNNNGKRGEAMNVYLVHLFFKNILYHLFYQKYLLTAPLLRMQDHPVFVISRLDFTASFNPLDGNFRTSLHSAFIVSFDHG